MWAEGKLSLWTLGNFTETARARDEAAAQIEGKER